jgi:hypothetical protein
MRSMKFAAGLVAVSLGLGMTAMSASAEQVANVSSCLERAAQVKTALNSNAQSANVQQATKEEMYGRAFCNGGFYAKGITAYDHALQLLGVAQNADAAATH